MAQSYEELVVPADPVDRAALQIEARATGKTIHEVATERFVAALEAEIGRAKEAFFGPDRPSRGRKQ